MIRGGNIGCSRKRSVEARRIIFAGFVRIDDTNEMVISWITFVDQKAIIRKKRGIYLFQERLVKGAAIHLPRGVSDHRRLRDGARPLHSPAE